MNKMGFGYLRLPKTADGAVDYALLSKMADEFIARGGRYFDTAYTYLDGESERALRETVVKRYPREKFMIADKIAPWKMKTAEDGPRMIGEMLERCGVEYFDVLLLHGLTQENYEIALKFGMFDLVRQMKKEGRAKKIGLSFHDSAEVLERILSQQKDMEIVQLQINYADWESVSLQAKKLYETAVAVVRYFGGIKLGAGGLVRAYSSAAAENLDGADIRVLEMCAERFVEVEYTGVDSAQKFISTHTCTLLSTDYGERVRFRLAVKKADADGFERELTDYMQGRVRVEKGEEYYAPFKE